MAVSFFSRTTVNNMAHHFPSIEVPTCPRFQGWTALFVFSAVALGAHKSALKNSGTSSTPAEKWVLIVTIMSMAFSLLAVIAHLAEATRTKFVGTKIEGGFATLLLVFWAAGLVYVMNPDLNMAATIISERPAIYNSNLYFSSWISFALIMLINGGIGQQAAGRDLVAQSTPKTMKWCGLAGCAMVMLASSITFHRSFNCNENGYSTDCKHNKYAISLGVIGTVFGVGMSYLTSKGSLKILYELIVSGVVFILFTAGVIVITFSPGPGTTIGNLYFSTWLAFIVSVMLFTECVREFMQVKSGDVETPSTPTIQSTGPGVRASTGGMQAHK